MAHHPAAVVVVSTTHEGGYRGLTATSFASVSLEPPLVLVCIESLATMSAAVLEAGMFNVSVLAARQEFLAERFAGRAPVVDPRWREVPHHMGRNRIPLVDGCVASFECDLLHAHSAGDHQVFVGLVQQATREPGEPLVYWDRTFWRLAPS